MTQNQLKNKKHIPIRTCIATGEKHPKNELIRIVNVKTDTGFSLQIDIRDKLNGRGANIIPDESALETAIKKKKFEQAFGRKIRDEEIEYLRENFPKAIEEKNFRPTNKPVIIKIKKDDIKSL